MLPEECAREKIDKQLINAGWDKLDHYLDSSKKIKQVSVASLKFMIMMQVCKDHRKWEFEEIKDHQTRILDIVTK